MTLEGALRFLKTLPLQEVLGCTFGSYDWDPFAACLRFPVHMVRQNVEGLMAEAYKVIDGGGITAGDVVQVRRSSSWPGEAGRRVGAGVHRDAPSGDTRTRARRRHFAPDHSTRPPP